MELNALGEGAAPLPVDPSAITFRSQDDLGVTAQKIAAVAFAGAGRAPPQLECKMAPGLTQGRTALPSGAGRTVGCTDGRGRGG